MGRKTGTGKKKKDPVLWRGMRFALKAGAFAGSAAAAFLLAKETGKTRKISREEAEKITDYIEKQKAKEKRG
ncbi:MAG: hypothetical protein Q4G07_03170 [Oscillospiraceae bacterium]|nr:hypothetical protein [Oscillospiraceae bacterium]